MHGKTAEEILAHPRFAAARRAHVDALVGLFAGDRFVTRLMIDAGTITFRGLLLGFHAAFDENDPTTWATPGQLRKYIGERGLASARRVDDMIARFRQARYVESAVSPADNRVHVPKPTEPLIAHDRDHLAAYHRFLLDLYSGRGYEWTIEQDLRAQLAPKFDLDIHEMPVKIPGQHVYMAWHIKMDGDPGHKWLREAIQATARERLGGLVSENESNVTPFVRPAGGGRKGN